MTEKERRVALLNEDLQAGRVKLPDDHEFKREYLGEWKEPAYAMTAPRGAAHLCALCREPIALDPGVYTAAQIDERIAAHHAVCSKRPIAVGDYVRWAFPERDTWADGEVTEIWDNPRQGKQVTIRIADDSGGWGTCLEPVRRGVEHTFGCNTADGVSLRRIPRPAEAQAMEWAAWRCQARLASGRQCPVLTYEPDNRDHWLCDDHRPPPALVNIDDMPLNSDALHYRHDEEFAKRLWRAADQAMAPALVDGIDREHCLARWMENRLAVEMLAAPPNAMTRMQRDVGRVMWLERYGAKRSAELRAKVAAGREAARNQVTYCEVDPCD